MNPSFSKHLFYLSPGNSATSTPASLDLPDPKGQVTPKPENSNQPAKKVKVAVKTKQQLQKRQHAKKASFKKQNGISKGADSELSTVPSITKAQAFSMLQDSSQPAEKATVIREPKMTRKLKQQSPKLQSSKKVAFQKQNAPPKGMDTETSPVLTLSKTQSTQKPENCVQPLGSCQGSEKVKQQLPQQPSKKAAFQKQNGRRKRLNTPTMSALGSSQPPPAKRRKSQSRGRS